MPISAGEAMQILSTLQHMDLADQGNERQSADQGQGFREQYAGANPDAENIPADVQESVGRGMSPGTRPMLAEPLSKTVTNSKQRLMLMAQADEDAKVLELLQGMSDSGAMPDALKPHLKTLMGISAKRNQEHSTKLQEMFPRASKGLNKGKTTPGQSALEQFSFPGAQGIPGKQ